MLNRTLLNCSVLLLAAMATLLPAAPAAAMTAEQYFQDGNRLFRDDLYWAALLRYRQAADEGMNSALLHYNTGVAHYRADQHIRARQSLLRSLDNPSLRVASQYNLGLNAFALGENEEALRWFRLVRDQEENRILQRYAVVAISRIRDIEARPTEFEVRVAEHEKQQKRAFANLQLRARVSFGNDDNVFRTPSGPYVDFSDPAQPVVTPTVQSGVYMPVSLSAKYTINSLPFEGFYVAYRAAARYYQDSELENANEYHHELAFGSEYRRREEDRSSRILSAFKVAQHRETYYDPDDGTSRVSGGVNVDGRMNYLRYGPELSLRRSYRRLALGAVFKGQLWDYDDTEVLPEYDHEYFLTRLYTQYKLSETSLVRLTGEVYSRRYSDRPSYDLDGAQRLGNPNVRYDYWAASFRARQRITDSMWFGVDYGRTERTDKHVGYNDYTRDDYAAEFHWSPGERFDFEINGIYRLYDYPNAFAFHEPGAPIKDQESTEVRVLGSFRMTRSLTLVAEGRYTETVSNDTRIEYERTEYLLGVRWQH